MKAIKMLLVVLLATMSSAVMASDKVKTFKVSGVCSMCKKKIETAAKIPGVKSFSWNEETKLAKVSYDNKIVSLESIQQKIASAGYDTEKYKAEDKAFNNLPSCCQYERKAAIK